MIQTPERKILIVEDEEGIALHLQFILRRLGYTAIGPADTGEAAIQMAHELRPDLVLMDIYLASRMSGIDAATQIRARDQIPVIYLTALAGDDVLSAAYSSDPYAYLVKPVQERELRAAIELAFYRHDMEQRLRESEERYRMLFKTMTPGFGLFQVISGSQGEVENFELVDMNPAFELMFESTYEALVGRQITDLLETNDIDLYRDYYPQISQVGQSIRFEYHLVGSNRTYDVTAYTPREGQVAAIIDDITERRRAEETIQESETRFRQMAEAVNEVFWLYAQPEGKMLYISPAFTRIWGRSVEEIYANPQLINESIHPDDLPKVLLAQKNMVDCGQPFNEEYRIRRPDGSLRWIWGRTFPAAEENGEVTRYSGIAEDITERRRAEMDLMVSYRRTEQALRRMTVLRNIDLAITTHTDLQKMIGTVLEHLVTLSEVDAALLFYPDNPLEGGSLRLAGWAGLMPEALSSLVIMGMGHEAARVFKNGSTLYIDDLSSAQWVGRMTFVAQMGFSSCAILPLVSKGQVKGVLLLFRQSPDGKDSDLLDFFHALALQTAIAIDNVDLFQGLRQTNAEISQAYDETISGWAQALELRDKETCGHSERVVHLAVSLARNLGMPEDEIVHFRRGVLLHDIGKMAIPDSILLKEGSLTDDEWEVMHQHPQLAYDMLCGISYLRQALDVPFCHHERWDGTGYPRGLKGTDIPRSARIFAVVDAFDALISDRPYRPPWPPQDALDYLRSQAGIQFDAEVVEAFLKIIERVR